ncbi:hypothetical protein MASR1M90_24090 [Desulfovibrionales bacterium]
MGKLGYFLLGTLLGVAGTVATAYVVASDSDSDLEANSNAELEADDFDAAMDMEAEPDVDFPGDEEPSMA